MKIEFSQEAYKDYLEWKQVDVKKFTKINVLLKDIQLQPFKGIGKPEPLKYEYQGYWYRRIDRVNRLVYKVENKIKALDNFREVFFVKVPTV